MRERSLAVSIGAIMAASGAFAQPEVVSRMFLAEPVVSAPGTFAVDIVVQAQVVGDPDAINIASMNYEFAQAGGAISNPFSPAPLTIREAIPGLDQDGLDFQGRAGMFPRYRSVIGSNNDDLGNGQPLGDRWSTLPLNLALLDMDLVENDWSNVYKLRWTTDDLSARMVQVDLDTTFGGYRILPDGFLVQPIVSRGSSIEFQVPAPANAALLCAGLGVAARRRR